MPRFRSETIGTGDQTWLDSTHGIGNARTVPLDPTAWTAGTHYPNGYIASGFPVAVVGGFAVPYDVTAGTTTNAGVLAGHILTDQVVVGTQKINVPVLSHGRVKVSKVAAILAAFVKPTVAAKNATTIDYI